MKPFVFFFAASCVLAFVPGCKKDAPEAPAPAPEAPVAATLGAPRGIVLPGGEITAFATNSKGDALAITDSAAGVWWWTKGATSWSRLTSTHTEAPLEAMVSPDGRLLATAGADNRLILWDTASGKVLHDITAHNGDVKALAFSPDGKRVATGGVDEDVRVWSVETGKQLHEFKGHTSSVYDVIFSADGQAVFSASRDATVRRWTFDGADPVVSEPLANTVSGLGLSTLPDPEEPTARVDVVVALGLTGEVSWLDAHTLEPLGRREVGNSRLSGMAVLPDGNLAIGEQSGDLAVYHADPAADGVVLSPFRVSPTGEGSDEEPVNRVERVDGGVAIATDHSLRYLATPLAEPATSVRLGPELPALGTPGTTLASGAPGFAAISRGRVFVFTGNAADPVRALPKLRSDVSAIAFSGSALVAGTQDGRLVISRDLTSWVDTKGSRVHQGAKVAFLAARGDALVSGSSKGELRAVDPDTLAKSDAQLQAPGQRLLALDLSPSGGTVVSVTADGTAIARELDTQRIVWTRLSKRISALRAAPKGHAFGAGDVLAFVEARRRVVLYDLGERTEVARLEGQQEDVLDLDVHPTAPIVATFDEEHTVRLWNARSGARLAEAHSGESFAGPVLFNAAGDQLAVMALGADGALRVFPCAVK